MSSSRLWLNFSPWDTPPEIVAIKFTEDGPEVFVAINEEQLDAFPNGERFAAWLHFGPYLVLGCHAGAEADIPLAGFGLGDREHFRALDAAQQYGRLHVGRVER